MKTDLEMVHLELKYCERCGGLWTRPRGSGEVYCAACIQPMMELPVAPRRRSQPRLPLNDRKEIKGQVELGLVDMGLVCWPGGNA